MVGAGSAYARNRLTLSLRLSLPACSLMSRALAVNGLVSEAMRKRESADAGRPGATCPRPLSRTTCPCWLIDIEQAALVGIARASNDFESDDVKSSAVGRLTGSVGFVHAQTIATTHTAPEKRSAPVTIRSSSRSPCRSP